MHKYYSVVVYLNDSVKDSRIDTIDKLLLSSTP